MIFIKKNAIVLELQVILLILVYNEMSECSHYLFTYLLMDLFYLFLKQIGE